MVDHIADTYYRVNANVHRGVHTLSQEATDAHEAARRRVQQFIGAGSSSEIIFTRGTTEAINLVASSFGDEFLHDGDEVILTVMEHHANIVPWQLLQRRRNIKLRVVPILSLIHISEPTRQAEISYAVFCLKKKKQNNKKKKKKHEKKKKHTN